MYFAPEIHYLKRNAIEPDECVIRTKVITTLQGIRR